MSGKTWLLLLGITGAVIAGYTAHIRGMGRLEGEIKARGESIKQLAHLAARQDVVYRSAKKKFLAAPTVEGCTAVIQSCDQRDSTKQAEIDSLNKQNKALEQLAKRGRLTVFGAAAYQPPGNKPILKGPLSAQAGASFRIKRGLFLDGYRDLPLLGDSTHKPTWNIRIRKEFRIF